MRNLEAHPVDQELDPVPGARRLAVRATATDSELEEFGARFLERSKPFVLVTTSALNLFAPVRNLLANLPNGPTWRCCAGYPGLESVASGTK